MQQNADQGAKKLFFAFIIVCVIAAIIALGLISQGGGANTKTQSSWGWGGDYSNDDDDDHDDDDDD